MHRRLALGRALGGAVLALLTLAPVGAHAQQPSPVGVDMEDNFFYADPIRVPVGATVEWSNEGRSPHTATADDGSFDSGNVDPGGAFGQAFDQPGVFAYFCRYHGGAGGIGMAGTIVVGDEPLPSAGGGEVGPGREPVPTPPGSTLRVPSEYPSIQAAVDAAAPADLVLVEPGEYHEAVQVTTPYLTIRGTDRDTVILDGDFEKPNGIHVVEADGVVVENMTARHYRLNGFFWTAVNGYRGSYLTAYDNGDYGLYAFDSVWGRFEHSYASGHPDSGFYIGQCYPCHAVIDDVVAEWNGIGYSGTNAGGDLKIVNSVWTNNQGGIVPNSLDSEANPPQREAYIAGNLVYDNNNQEAPAKDVQAAALGTGILLAGGIGNVVEHNAVWDHGNYGVLVSPILDENLWITEDNTVRDNLVRGSGRADLALAAPAGGADCFEDNDFRTSLPPAIEVFHGCGRIHAGGGGDLAATFQTLALFVRVLSGDYPHGDWKTAPEPPPQAQMPDAETAPAVLAVPEEEVPGPVEVRPVSIPDTVTQSQEVTVLGVSLAAPTWWSLLLSTFAYVLPLVLYVAWVSIAIWDLIRQESESTRRRLWWMVVILIVPFIGPLLYFAFGRSPIPGSLRLMLTGGAFLIYVAIAALALVIGGS